MSAETKPKHIGRNISRLRELKGIKQEVLAYAIGVSQQSISNIEASEKIDEERLVEIAKALGVSTEAIKNFSEENMITYFNTFTDNDFSNNQGAFAHQQSNNTACTFNPLDKVVELYERLVQAEKEKLEYVEKLLKDK